LFPIFRVLRRFHFTEDFTGFLVIPDRYAMPPPELPAQAPVHIFLDPMLVNTRPAFRTEIDVSALHEFQRFLKLRITQPPLIAQAWLYRHLAAFAEADVVFDTAPLFPARRGRGDVRWLLCALRTVQARERFAGEGVHRGVGVHDVDDGQIVAQADFVIRLVVRGRHFQHAGAEFEIDMVVANDRDEPLLLRNLHGERAHHMFADEMGVARILRVHGNGSVAGMVSGRVSRW